MANYTATEYGKCESCAAELTFRFNAETDKWSPWTVDPEDGSFRSHFADCAEAGSFRRPKKPTP